VIPSISGIYDDGMGVCQTQTQKNDDGGPPRYRPMEFHDARRRGWKTQSSIRRDRSYSRYWKPHNLTSTSNSP
ncbi:hypothetical protein PHISCL_10975, partial [Aspergillus sclerotialis]